MGRSLQDRRPAQRVGHDAVDAAHPPGHGSKRPGELRRRIGGVFDPILAELVPNDTQLSTLWSKPRDRIDYLLLSERARKHYVKGSATVHREAGARKASDHYPVSVCLQLCG